MSPLITKLVVTTFAGGGAVISSPFVLSHALSTNKVSLTKEKLDLFKQTKGFASCFPFIQEDSKLSSLFICLKKKTIETTDNTFIANYYFYNGNSWEEAISLRNKPNIKNTYLVDTKGSWFGGIVEREITNSWEEPSNLDKVGKNWKCEFNPTEVQGDQRKNRVFSCKLGETTLKWPLKDFQ